MDEDAHTTNLLRPAPEEDIKNYIYTGDLSERAKAEGYSKPLPEYEYLQNIQKQIDQLTEYQIETRNLVENVLTPKINQIEKQIGVNEMAFIKTLQSYDKLHKDHLAFQEKLEIFLKNQIKFNQDKSDNDIAFMDRFNKLGSHIISINDNMSTLEDKIATEIEILQGFNKETQKGYNDLSRRISELEKFVWGNELGVKNIVNRIADLDGKIDAINNQLEIIDLAGTKDNSNPTERMSPVLKNIIGQCLSMEHTTAVNLYTVDENDNIISEKQFITGCDPNKVLSSAQDIAQPIKSKHNYPDKDFTIECPACSFNIKGTL